MMRIFVGYDSREVIAYHVCVQSILEKSTIPIAITPLCLSNLQREFFRKREPGQLTDFSYSRFLVPYLCEFEGWALFIDGDMMIRTDISKVLNLQDETKAVQVVKHPDFAGTHSFLGNSIPTFPKFNWSSVMLFNNKKCKALTQEFVHTASYHELHQFKWVGEEGEVGELPASWNHLVGFYPENENADLVHWTKGGPYLGGEFEKSEFSKEWFALRDKTLFSNKC